MLNFKTIFDDTIEQITSSEQEWKKRYVLMNAMLLKPILGMKKTRLWKYK
ncbi:hypothetical protein LY28_03502 [Ruminiclostridium sufflavum DSM 19573]|uniref:Uncharacterized protein n=1 Tax=Ruminiclostridium sufflavum DSM 19573 TaxID=1121337 RepID=A0A318XG94_9FIRM|nr:hypothetical protein [Ruminiclostridium sufflavum]PYG84881.1 hypothetical protein LY28_03502 [Ruminiclostridium sufflavum DSM 19573]